VISILLKCCLAWGIQWYYYSGRRKQSIVSMLKILVVREWYINEKQCVNQYIYFYSVLCDSSQYCVCADYIVCHCGIVIDDYSWCIFSIQVLVARCGSEVLCIVIDLSSSDYCVWNCCIFPVQWYWREEERKSQWHSVTHGMCTFCLCVCYLCLSMGPVSGGEINNDSNY